MSKQLKRLFTKLRSKDTKSAAFIIVNKHGIKEQYEESQKMKESKHTKSPHKYQEKNEFNFDFSHLGRLSLSDDESDISDISIDSIVIDEPKFFQSETNLKRSHKPFANPKETTERVFIPSIAMDRQSSVNTTEISNKMHTFPQKRVKPKIAKRKEPKSEWVDSINEERVIPMRPRREITSKITETPVLISGNKKRQSLLLDIRERQSKDVTAKIGTNVTLTPNSETENKEEITHAYPKSDLFGQKTKVSQSENENEMNHSYPKSDLFKVKGISHNQNNASHALSWAIPMNNQNKAKPPKLPSRLGKKGVRPRWR